MMDSTTRIWGVARRLAALFLLLHCALGEFPVYAQDGAAEATRNPARVSLVHEHAEQYKGGQGLAVTVYIAATQWDGLTAMGLYETVPEGWTYGGVREISGPLPGVLPENGASGVLQFLWIDQPRAPVAFQYLLNVPPQDGGARFLSGQVEYRLGEGALTSNVALSRIDGEADAAPVLTLIGPASLSVRQDTPFDDPGVTATDAEDGDLSSRIEVAGVVDTASPGAYTLTYGVMDSVGNRADPVTREVIVTESTEEPGGGAPDNPDPAAGSGAPSPGLGSDPTAGKDRMASARRPANGLGASPASIPDVTLRERASEYELPLKSGTSGAAPDGESGFPAADLEKPGAFRSASASAQATPLGGLRRDAAASESAEPGSAEASHGQSGPAFLVAAAVLLAFLLPVAWRRRVVRRRGQ